MPTEWQDMCNALTAMREQSDARWHLLNHQQQEGKMGKEKTIEDFLAALRQTPRDWQIELSYIDGFPEPKFIRRRSDENDKFCPLTAIYTYSGGHRKTYCTFEYREAAAVLGYSRAQADEIAKAADATSGYDHDLRRQILDACGLEKRGEPCQ